MSRWLWALLGGVVLVAIAALFWTETNVTPPVSPSPTAVVPAPAPAPPASAPVAQKPAPPPPPAPALPTAQEAASPPAPSPTPPPAPPPAPDAGQQAATPPAPPPPLETPSGSAGRRSAPAAARARTGGVGSPGRICAQEPCAAGRDLGLFRGGLRAAIPAARRRLGLSPAGGQVRPGRDCRVRQRRSFCLPPLAGSRARLKRKARSR